jgi:hypothetical protein
MVDQFGWKLELSTNFRPASEAELKNGVRPDKDMKCTEGVLFYLIMNANILQGFRCSSVDT